MLPAASEEDVVPVVHHAMPNVPNCVEQTEAKESSHEFAMLVAAMCGPAMILRLVLYPGPMLAMESVLRSTNHAACYG